MIKKWSLILPVFLFACGGGAGIEGPEANPDQNQVESAGPIDPNIQAYLTFDVLGGVFRKAEAPAQAMLLGQEPEEVTTGKSVTHLPASEGANEASTDAYAMEPILIDYSREYVGHEGKGRMALSVYAEGEEISTPNAPDAVVKHFSRLSLRFVFHDFAFNNPCLGVTKLKGEIACEVTGDYDTGTEEFLGEANCQNGPTDNPAPLLYRVPQKDFSVELDAHLAIDGDPYRYRSYIYEGTVVIDGEPADVKEKVLYGAFCQAKP